MVLSVWVTAFSTIFFLVPPIYLQRSWFHFLLSRIVSIVGMCATFLLSIHQLMAIFSISYLLWKEQQWIYLSQYLWSRMLSSFGKMPRSGITGSHSRYILHTVSQSEHTSLCSHQQWMRGPFPNPPQSSLPIVLLILVLLTGWSEISVQLRLLKAFWVVSELFLCLLSGSLCTCP